ncbi:MAG: histidine triad nucleotide-binding protein [Gemmatimonadetes bacterium]|jgi:histidine triad (HIT) family protein|nr:histidine triad nucleotide-binding protein [Gemmatimonadota bacterium]MBP9105531.1 histidine triad nucleotide-binding protein [Gemmatimonadaceae bacterium]MBK6455656.1 histidine triad nucleotide-binding protein [Gemmatimonadota bacterium]MBK6841828.1 histidine triad nucleotide-binding protein [Gemmatimonadota bacterium]MBK7835530.1 histidine triad nucleotide-binding protein [Gemmatimonadota bacterium]
MATDCLFCRIVSGEIPAGRVAENAHCIAFRDISPKAPTHILVIPRAHVPSLNQVESASLAGELLLMAAAVARAEGIAESGYRVILNTNADGGQTVYHLHAHVMGGRAMDWPPG